MKQLNWAQNNLTLVIMAMFYCPFGVAQNGEDVDDPKPSAETEIICYAAKSKWVCAPADEKEKAHEKAMKLAQQPDEKHPGFNQSDVEIQTMDVSNNFNEQVQETPSGAVIDPNSLEAAIKDFVPRDDVNQADANQESEPVAQTTEAVVQTPVEAAELVKPVENEPTTESATPTASTVSSQQPISTAVRSVANDFGDWQRNHADQWAFQVVGTSNRHHLDQFIIDQGIDQGPFAVVRTQVNGADWWVVLAGLYDSREQALSQRSVLPAQLAAKAWVRQIKSITGQAD